MYQPSHYIVHPTKFKYFFRLIPHNKTPFTNNTIVNKLWIYIPALIFIILIFPIHISNYVYVNTQNKYASVNVTLYRFLRILNINTVKNSINKMQVNGKEKQLKFATKQVYLYKIIKNLWITKIVQLTDFGLQRDVNAYLALLQNNLTNALYTLMSVKRGTTKFKNYTLLNYEHGQINYYAKVGVVINLFIVIKIISILFWEKIKNV